MRRHNQRGEGWPPYSQPTQKQTQTSFFWRNMIGLAACAMMFGTFVALGPALRFILLTEGIALSRP